MYLDKPMRDHVLLQAFARVNRPYVDANGVRKRVGLVIDFVGVLRELKKALQFDSSDVSSVIEDLDLRIALWTCGTASHCTSLRARRSTTPLVDRAILAGDHECLAGDGLTWLPREYLRLGRLVQINQRKPGRRVDFA
jgi:hypothetical protein